MSGRFLRAAAVAASFVSSAIAQSFIKPAPGTTPSYAAGQQVQIQWSSPWEWTQLQLYQGPDWVYTALLNNVSQSTTSYTWTAAPLQGNTVDGQFFYFEIVDYSNLQNPGVGTNEFQLTKAVSISVSQPSSTMTTSTSASSAPSSSTATATAASTTGTASSMGKAPYSATSSSAAPAATSEASSGASSSSSTSESTTSGYPNYTSSYLGVGLGLGIPVVLAVALGAFFAIRNKRKMSRESIALEKGRGAA